MAENTAGELRLIEIGDGQVSDIKEWNVDKFLQMFLNMH
nr:ATP-grasp domain-containing protein [Pectobacterium sp. PL152]